ncbi:MAG: hypothetical protein ACK5M1_11380 [Xanthomarina gelatinilytica]|uniref:hypothetical protein n=1 Tax=Xanthomarina gelatinilytica TaxID=1137281 RepID=UPI003A86F4EA
MRLLAAAFSEFSLASAASAALSAASSQCVFPIQKTLAPASLINENNPIICCVLSVFKIYIKFNKFF